MSGFFGTPVDQSAWTVYSPTLSSTGGSLATTGTTATATGRYKRIGKTISVEMDIGIVAIGTASGALIATLPFAAAAFKFAGIVFEYTLTGKSGAGYITTSGTTLQSRDAAAGSWWVNSYNLAVTAVYETP